uniref:Transmembrane protein 14C n=1 Tax=Mesocestoides corti TaxID=53468 RepID=A0A5K3FLF4_MESCO
MFDQLSLGYALFIILGGVYGYYKAGSLPSLVSGVAFGVILLIGSYKLGQNPGDANCLLGGSALLALIMAVRYYNTRKLMPAGIVCVLR